MVSEDIDFAADGIMLYANNEFVVEKTDGIYTTVDFLEYNKATNGYDYIHNIKSIINQNTKKDILFEKWKGTKVDISANKYVRFDDTVVSISEDGVYWKDIELPKGMEKVQQVQVGTNNVTVVSSEIELRYSFNTEVDNSLRTYIEIDDKILGFDTEPVIESDRTLVPLRFIFETLGADVDWEDSSQTAIVKKEEATIFIFY